MPFLRLLTAFIIMTEPGQAQNWTGISSCGTYQVKGIVRSTENGPIIVVNEKSQSEITISVPIPNEVFLAPFEDRAIVASVELTKKFSFANIIGTIKNIKSRNAHPLNSLDTQIVLISKATCQ